MKSIQFETGIKTVLITIFIGFSLSFYANNHIPKKSYYDHLSELNKEWLHHKEACPKGLISFRSDLDRIQLHLNLVIGHLKSNSPSNFNSEQLSNRLSLLGKLQEYADNKVFPVNSHHSIRTPYFVDELGTNCAVGQLIYVSGHEHLVEQISKEHNYDYIEDIHTKGLKEWATEFGFTLEELKWIQPSYVPTETIDQVHDGTNGEVNKIVRDSYNGRITIAGDFTELDSLPCLNIGIYKNDQLSCLGSGIEGTINDVLAQSGDIYAFGELHHSGQIFPMAKYDGSTWSYIGMPNRDGATATTANYGGFGYQLEIGISHGSIPQHQEVWYYLNDNTWEKQVKVRGVILDIIPSGYGRVHVGHFDSVTVYNANSMVDTSLVVNNVLIGKNYSDIWYGIGNDVSDTVNVVEEVGSALILGGTCSDQPEENNICISRYFNSTLQPLFINNIEGQVTGGYSIKSIAYRFGEQFMFGGDFEIQQMVGTSGSHLATYNLVNNRVEPIAILDQPVNTLSYYQGELYIGGAFQENLGDSVHFLGRITSTAGIKESVAETNLNIYPNPFTTTINLDGIENAVSYSIQSMDGRTAKKGTVLNEKINDLESLPKGSYILRLETEKGSVVKKIFK